MLGAVVAIVGLADLHSISAIGLYLTRIAGIVWAAAAVVAFRAPTVAAGRRRPDRRCAATKRPPAGPLSGWRVVDRDGRKLTVTADASIRRVDATVSKGTVIAVAVY